MENKLKGVNKIVYCPALSAYIRSDGKKVHESVWEYFKPRLSREERYDLTHETLQHDSAINMYFAYCLDYQLKEKRK